MKEDWFDKPAEISRRIVDSDAYRIYQRLLTLDTNFFIFDRNYKDLKLAIDYCVKPEHIHKLFDHNDSQRVLLHMVRYLHNYLASAKSLVEHTRILIKDWYRQTDFIEEYNSQIKERFEGNPLSGFIEDFRNYALHYSFPLTSLHIDVTLDPETGIAKEERVIFCIQKDALLEWSGWSKGRDYLMKFDQDILMENLVDEYYNQVINFHGWMHKRLEEIHAKELKWLNDMQKRIDELIKTIGYDNQTVPKRDNLKK